MDDSICTAGTGGALTKDDILRALDAMSKYKRPDRDVLGAAFREASIFGMSIVQHPSKIVPKVKMNRTFPCSDKSFEDMNAWLLARFGTRDESLVPRGMALQFGNTLVMRPEDVVRLGSLI